MGMEKGVKEWAGREPCFSPSRSSLPPSFHPLLIILFFPFLDYFHATPFHFLSSPIISLYIWWIQIREERESICLTERKGGEKGQEKREGSERMNCVEGKGRE